MSVDIHSLGETMNLKPQVISDLVELQRQKGDDGDAAVAVVMAAASERLWNTNRFDASQAIAITLGETDLFNERMEALFRVVDSKKTTAGDELAEIASKLSKVKINIDLLGRQLGLQPAITEQLRDLQQQYGERGDLAVGAMIMIAFEHMRNGRVSPVEVAFAETAGKRDEFEHRIDRLSQQVSQANTSLRESVAEKVSEWINDALNHDLDKLASRSCINVRAMCRSIIKLDAGALKGLGLLQVDELRRIIKGAIQPSFEKILTVNEVNDVDAEVVSGAVSSSDSAIADIFHAARRIMQEDGKDVSISQAISRALERRYAGQSDEMDRERREEYGDLSPQRVIAESIQQLRSLSGFRSAW